MNNQIITWYNKLEKRARVLVSVLGILAILTPVLKDVFNISKGYVSFILNGPALVDEVDELSNALFTITGIASSALPLVDNNVYYAKWKGDIIEGRVKMTKSGNLYVFIPDDLTGERCFAAYLNHDTGDYHFYDFDGNYISLKRKQ